MVFWDSAALQWGSGRRRASKSAADTTPAHGGPADHEQGTASLDQGLPIAALGIGHDPGCSSCICRHLRGRRCRQAGGRSVDHRLLATR